MHDSSRYGSTLCRHLKQALPLVSRSFLECLDPCSNGIYAWSQSDFHLAVYTDDLQAPIRVWSASRISPTATISTSNGPSSKSPIHCSCSCRPSTTKFLSHASSRFLGNACTCSPGIRSPYVPASSHAAWWQRGSSTYSIRCAPTPTCGSLTTVRLPSPDELPHPRRKYASTKVHTTFHDDRASTTCTCLSVWDTT